MSQPTGCAQPTVAVLYKDSREAKHLKSYEVHLNSYGVSSRVCVVCVCVCVYVCVCLCVFVCPSLSC